MKAYMSDSAEAICVLFLTSEHHTAYHCMRLCMAWHAWVIAVANMFAAQTNSRAHADADMQPHQFGTLAAFAPPYENVCVPAHHQTLLTFLDKAT